MRREGGHRLLEVQAQPKVLESWETSLSPQGHGWGEGWAFFHLTDKETGGQRWTEEWALRDLRGVGGEPGL